MENVNVATLDRLNTELLKVQMELAETPATAADLDIESSTSEEDDTDIEADNQNEELTEPFDPEEISINTRLVSMENCLRRLIQGTIKLNPDFQRNEVWLNDRKSRLIESLMLKIPLPMFYVSADEKGNFTVVDGLQRLSTIRSFILGDEYLKALANKEQKIIPDYMRGNGFKLEGLEFWKVYESKTFNDLPINIQNRILDTEFTFTVINPGTPEEVRRNIFKRINTGGLPLSSQEIRNALYMGQSSVLLKELSLYAEFKQATGKIKVLRMEDRELILRFIAFFVRDYTSYKRTVSVDTFLSDTMIIVNAMPTFDSPEFKRFADKEKDKDKKIQRADIIASDINKIKECFKKGMNRSYALFGNHTFRKSYDGKRKSQLNKSLFEMWGTLLGQLTDNEFSILIKNREALMLNYQPLLDESAFQLAISKDSMKHTSVKYRFDALKELINKNIQE